RIHGLVPVQSGVGDAIGKWEQWIGGKATHVAGGKRILGRRPQYRLAVPFEGRDGGADLGRKHHARCTRAQFERRRHGGRGGQGLDRAPSTLLRTALRNSCAQLTSMARSEPTATQEKP